MADFDDGPPDRAFPALRLNRRQGKPRTRGITEIRGPYYTPMGRRYLADVLETMGHHVDHLKFSGGSFTLMPRRAVKALLDVAHEHDVLVSTGGFIESVLPQGPKAVDDYLEECKALGFDIVEVSAGFITLPDEDWLALVRRVQETGLKAKPEVNIQFGAGGTSAVEQIEREGQGDPSAMIRQAKRLLAAGAYQVMVESEGITEQVGAWRTDVPAAVAEEVGLEKVMFEAAEPRVFQWYVKNFGPEVNLFVDHSQIVELEALRRGIWGTMDLWGRVVTYKP